MDKQYHSDDITFCTNKKCTRTKCMRNPKNIRVHCIPHSFADFDGNKDYCLKARELKPCPFCGGEAVLKRTNQCYANAYSVVCKDKFCRGRAIKAVRAEHTAIEMWNRRVNNG